MKVKKIPMRMCVGCRQMLPKKSMIRIVRQQDGTIHLDTTGKAAGRGAYICRGEQCLNACMKANALSKAFETKVDQELYEALREEMRKLDQTE